MRITIDNICLLIAVAGHLALATMLHSKAQQEFTPPKIAYAELIQAPISDKPAEKAAAPIPKPKVEARKAESKPVQQAPKQVAKQTPILSSENTVEEEHTPAPQEPVKEVQPAAQPAKQPTTVATTSSASTQTSAAGSAASDNVKETAPIFNAAYLSNPEPVYPRISQELEEEGRVLLRVTVSENGQPMNISLARSSGFSRLDKAAMDTVKRWRFVPAKRGEQAIVATVQVPIDFKLRTNS